MTINGAKFSGHESFAFRHTWLTKGVSGCAQDPGLFRQPDALVTLGVGKNMVRSIKHWCLATQIIEPHPSERFSHKPTRIGEALFLKDGGWDPYLEDEGTLWLIHYLLATNAETSTTIYYAFNEYSGQDFSSASMYEALWRLAERVQAKVTPGTLRRDISVFTRSYTGGTGERESSISYMEDSLDCPLADLKLVYEEPLRHTFEFARGPKDTLPDAVFFFALDGYAQSREERKSFSFDELAYFPQSPGRVFKLDEAALAERLEHMATLTGGAWQITDTAGYRQMIVRQSIDAFAVLRNYYRQRAGEIADGRN